MTVVQRYGSACELNVHLHSIVLDGVYVDESDGRPGFRPLPAPTKAELHTLTATVARKVTRALRRRGLLHETVLDDAAADEPALTRLLAESVAFPRARIVDPDRARPAADPAWFGSVAGFNLHASVRGDFDAPAHLRRPPEPPAGRAGRATMDDQWRDAAVAVLFTPEQCVAGLAALIPRPGKNLVRYHGVLAPNARDKAAIVPSARIVNMPIGRGDEVTAPAPTQGARDRRARGRAGQPGELR